MHGTIDLININKTYNLKTNNIIKNIFPQNNNTHSKIIINRDYFNSEQSNIAY